MEPGSFLIREGEQ
jgi:hypothetical protein